MGRREAARGGDQKRGRRVRGGGSGGIEREGGACVRRCGSGRAVGLAQNLRGAEGRCDSVRVFCEAGVDRAFTASQRISSGWWGRVGVEGKDGGCDGKGDLPGREDCGCENDVRAVSLAAQAARSS